MRKFTGPSNRPRGQHDTQRSVNLYPVQPEAPGDEYLASVPGLDVFSLPLLIYTSWPYPYEQTEHVHLGLAVPIAGRLWSIPDEELDLALALPQDGTLVEVLEVYDHPTPDAIDAGLALPSDGTLVDIVRTYDHPTPDAVDLGLAVPQTGTLVVVLVSYDHPTPDAIDAGLAIPQPGTLT